MSDYDIEFKDVSFTYAGSKEAAIKNINLTVKKGELLLITGPSGAGKTTLCRCLNGLVPHFYTGDMEGSVIVKGMNTKDETIGRLSAYVGLLFQDPLSQLVCPTVADEIAFGCENLGVPREEIVKRVEECLDLMRLRGYEDREPSTLSGGEQQACALASIVAMRPSIYVLDEPTSNLDPIGSHTVLMAITELAKREKKTMVIVEHKIEELAPIVDRMVVMNKGHIIIDDTPRKVLQESELLEEIGLKPPQVTVLCNRLSKSLNMDFGFPITLEEAYSKLSDLLRKRAKRSIQKEQKSQELFQFKDPIIKIKELWHIYPGGVVALKNVNLEVYRGDFLAIVGQNGCGKTTLVKHFNGLLKPTKGKVYIDGVDVETQTTAQLSRKVGIIFQNPDLQIVKSTVREEVAFALKNLGLPEEEIRQRTINALEAVGLKHAIDKDPHELSKGEKQKLNFASVIAMRPEVLVIDEVTTGHDYKEARSLMNLAKNLHEEGKTIILITHDMSLVAEYASRVIIMHQGDILYDGPVRDAFTKTDILKKSFLSPPQIIRLKILLGDYISENILTVEEMYDVIMRMVK
jgi:energy-coupling factor transport system ATP-binding protein